jgi:Lrp/AsnC family transcriptional regulator for asnA, asnC and gidA
MIDKKDKRVLAELLKDGRKSFADLARACKMTRQSIFSRIKSLRRKGIIKSFTVILDQHKLGLSLKAYILISAEPSEKSREEASKTLVQFPQISQIHRIFGRFDFLLEVSVKDIDELSYLIGKIHGLEMVYRTETLIVDKNLKFDINHPIEVILKQLH